MKKSLVSVSAIICTCFLMTVCASGETASGDEPVSLNFEQRPLGEVLTTITKITGHAFIIDDQWLDMPVSISVKATPLHRALKFIFTDINNAIIYRSDGKIKIIVYGESSEKDKGSGSRRTASPPQAASSSAPEQQPGSSPEAAPAETETDNLTDTAEEGEAPPPEEQESTEEQTENPAEGTAEEPGESTEETTE